MINTTAMDWNTRMRLSFDRLRSSSAQSVPDTQMRDILLGIGLLTIASLVFLAILRCLVKVRQIYRDSEPEQHSKKFQRPLQRFTSYQQLLNQDSQQCKCSQYSCLPKPSCLVPNRQIIDRDSYYEQIDGGKGNRRIFQLRHPSYIRVHRI